MEEVDHFIDLIAYKRKEHGLTLGQVAIIVDCSKTQIHDLEKKKTRNPSLKLALKLSVLFDINLNKLTCNNQQVDLK